MRLFSFLSVFSLVFITSCQEVTERLSDEFTVSSIPETLDYFETRKKQFNEESLKAKLFLKSHLAYNQEVVFLIDMKMPSEKFRFFVCSTTNDSILKKGLVAHGSGSTFSSDSLIFSNVPDSYKTSLGNYKIGNSYNGNFGKSYKLHGLDATNNKAYQRLVVFHPYTCVPDEEQDFPICESLGCPMVSNKFMSSVYPIIDGSKKPILMVIYY